MASDTVQQVKERLSIVDVVSGYVKLNRAGSTLRARCPFHAERTPSFFVSPERGTYHCFGCNVGGDIFSFVMQIEGLDFKGALKVLAEKAGVPLVYSKRSPDKDKDAKDRLFELMEAAAIFYSARLTDAARKYLNLRGIEERTIKAFRVGFAGNAWDEASLFLRAKGFSEKEILDAGLAKRNERGTLTDKFRNRIMFPISDSASRVVGFSGRIYGENASPEAPKYLNSPETPLYRKSDILYGFDMAKHAIRRHNCAVLVEGQMDLLSSHQAGWGNTVAVSGTAFTPQHASMIRRLTENLVIALDADEAGIKATGKAARAAITAGLHAKVASLPSGLDPAELILSAEGGPASGGKEAWRSVIREAKDIITFLLDVLEQHSPPKISKSDIRPTDRAGDLSRQKDKFRRNVEAVVLPFLTDIQSPIAREQYIREIARRLEVSEKAVSDAAALLPRQAGAFSQTSAVGGSLPAQAGASGGKEQIRDPAKTADRVRPDSAQGYERVKQAFSLLLWQESLAKPEIDIKPFTEEFERIIGADAFAILRKLEESEKESLRFSAEKLHGKSTGLKREAKILLSSIMKDKLAGKLAEAAIALRKAEDERDEKKAAELMEECRLLTTQIAQIRE